MHTYPLRRQAGLQAQRSLSMTTNFLHKHSRGRKDQTGTCEVTGNIVRRSDDVTLDMRSRDQAQ